MIAYLKGEVADLSEDHLVLEVNQIGYNIKISSRFAQEMKGKGSEIKVYTYTYVKEDAFHLYGFASKEELAIFKKLITVNGIGPKGALAILSIMDEMELRFAIYAGDAKAIAKASGIGAKTAERVILDLRDKVSIEIGPSESNIHSYAENVQDSANAMVKTDAIEALIALGYQPSEARKAVNAIIISEEMDANKVLKEALKHII